MASIFTWPSFQITVPALISASVTPSTDTSNLSEAISIPLQATMYLPPGRHRAISTSCLRWEWRRRWKPVQKCSAGRRPARAWASLGVILDPALLQQSPVQIGFGADFFLTIQRICTARQLFKIQLKQLVYAKTSRLKSLLALGFFANSPPIS